MRTKYEVRGDKENNYDAPMTSTTFKPNLNSPNNILRKRIEENLLRNEEQGKKQGVSYLRRDERERERERRDDNKQKFEKYGRASEFLNDNSMTEFNKFNDGGHKRQNAKKRQFDVKINNIQALNDKIENLLTLVKKQRRFDDKIKEKQKFDQKIKDISIDAVKKPNIYDRKRAPGSISPFNGCENSSQFSRKFDFNSKQLIPISKLKNYPEHKQDKHSRAFSNIQTPPSTKHKREAQILARSTRKLIDQEQKKSNGPERKYEYSKQENEESPETNREIDYIRSKYSQKYLKDQRKASNISHTYAQEQIRYEKRKDRCQEREIRLQNLKELESMERYSKLKYDQKDQQSIIQSINQVKAGMSPVKNLSAYERPRTRNFEFDQIPLSIDSPTRSKYEKCHSSTMMIDEQIMKIKSKIQESEKSKHKVQQKYSELNHQERQSDQNTGKLYSNRNNINDRTKLKEGKKFQLKVFPVQNTKVNVTKLVEKLNHQVQLDIKLRSLRQSFQSYSNPDKWNLLRRDLQHKGVRLSQRELQDLMKISGDEHNPFTTEKSPQLNNIYAVSEHMAASQNYWNQQVDRCVSEKHLHQQGFSVHDIDLNKKGYLNIEDLVCFINLYSGNFYRNRDVSMLYKRFARLERKSNNGIDFKTFLNKVASR